MLHFKAYSNIVVVFLILLFLFENLKLPMYVKKTLKTSMFSHLVNLIDSMELVQEAPQSVARGFLHVSEDLSDPINTLTDSREVYLGLLEHKA